MRYTLISLVALALVVSPVWADRIVKKDGTELKGQVVSETATTVVIEVARGGAVIKFPVERSEIVSVEKGPVVTTPPATKPVAEPGPSGPGYYALPVMGEIGTDVTAATLKEALGHARRVSPAVIVIVFDTEGGDLEQARQMVEVLGEQPKDLRVVAYVKKALSSGAIVAMGCREIYLAPDAVIGASAVEDVTAKTAARLAAEQGGHAAALAEGMFDPDAELMVGKVEGTRIAFVAGEANEARDAKVLKSKGRLLTLSAEEAVACGLARGTLDSLDRLHAALGMSEALAKLASPGWYLIERKGREARDAMARQAFKAERQKAYDEYMEKAGPQIEEIDARLEQIKPELRASQDTLRDLDVQWTAETRAIENEYRLATRIDNRVSPERRARLLDDARARRDQKLTLARERFQPRAIEQRERINELTREQQALTKKRRALVDAAPKVPK
jgi:ATP-dependent protease ClpP protease subunit